MEFDSDQIPGWCHCDANRKKQKKLKQEANMRQKLNLTELSRIELSDVKGGGPDPNPRPDSCDSCGGDLSYVADDLGDNCKCASIFYAIGLFI